MNECAGLDTYFQHFKFQVSFVLCLKQVCVCVCVIVHSMGSIPSTVFRKCMGISY